MKEERTCNMAGALLLAGDCREVMKGREFIDATRGRDVVIVTDPPFNIGYGYDGYADKMPDEEYMTMLGEIVGGAPSVVIHYPETLYKLAIKIKKAPDRVVAWVYNSHLARQHRDIAFWGIVPRFGQVLQPYKNPKDKRIKARIEAGSKGCRIYDWWNVQQVKNVSREKTGHPCQMPAEVMDNVIGVLPRGNSMVVVDPFMGSGTTGEACVKAGVPFIGIEISPKYYEIARERIVKSLRDKEEE